MLAGQYNELLMFAIRERDPYIIMNLAVHAYNMQPKRRIDSECRLWKDQPAGPPFGKPGEMAWAVIASQVSFGLGIMRVVRELCVLVCSGVGGATSDSLLIPFLFLTLFVSSMFSF